MLTTKEAASKLFVCTGAVRHYIRVGVGKVKLIILNQEWEEDPERGWVSHGWNEPEGYVFSKTLEYDKFNLPIKAEFASKEKLKAIQVKHGMRTEYRIKNDDLEEFRKKWLV